MELYELKQQVESISEKLEQLGGSL